MYTFTYVSNQTSKNEFHMYSISQKDPLTFSFISMTERDCAHIEWAISDLVICQCFLVSDGFLWSIEWKTPYMWPVPTMSEHVACPSVSPSVSVCSLVLCYSIWYDWYETRRNTLYKTICSVSLSTGSCQYNGGMRTITPIFLYFVNFCISLPAGCRPFFCVV